ncbi:hypothetical protein N341_02226, partial [Tyto alba]
GSVGLDVATAISFTLLDQKPQKVPTRIRGPLIINGQLHGALLIGRSSSSIKGLNIIPGLIDADFTGIVQLILQVFPPLQILEGSKVAQLVPLNQLTCDITPATSRTRDDRGFASTGPAAMLTMSMNRRP